MVAEKTLATSEVVAVGVLSLAVAMGIGLRSIAPSEAPRAVRSIRAAVRMSVTSTFSRRGASNGRSMKCVRSIGTVTDHR